MANSGPFNTFSNDGSFFEQFKKMQELQKATPTVSKPTVTMKLGAVKKSAPPISLRTEIKSTSVKRAFEEETSDSEGEQIKESRKGKIIQVAMWQVVCAMDNRVHPLLSMVVHYN